MSSSIFFWVGNKFIVKRFDQVQKYINHDIKDLFKKEQLDNNVSSLSVILPRQMFTKSKQMSDKITLERC